MSKHYIVPLDGSALSETALPWARRLAELEGANLLLLRTIPTPFAMFSGPEPADVSELDDSGYREYVQEYLQRKAGEFPKDMAQFQVADGHPADAVFDASHSEHAVAIVMASHGRGGLGRWLLGSVATKIARGSRLPLLVVNARTQVDPTPEVNRILVPLDGSKLSETALDRACRLATQFQAELRLYRSTVSVGLEYESERLKKILANEYLSEVSDRLDLERVQTETDSLGPAKGIAAQSSDCDLIVMGSHGRSGVRRWMLGSVAERVIQEAHRPVLLIYDRDEPETKDE